MKPLTAAGSVLIVVSIMILVLQGTSFTKKNATQADPAKAARENEDVVPVLPIIGAVSLAGGIFLVVLSTQKQRL